MSVFSSVARSVLFQASPWVFYSYSCPYSQRPGTNLVRSPYRKHCVRCECLFFSYLCEPFLCMKAQPLPSPRSPLLHFWWKVLYLSTIERHRTAVRASRIPTSPPIFLRCVSACFGSPTYSSTIKCLARVLLSIHRHWNVLQAGECEGRHTASAEGTWGNDIASYTSRSTQNSSRHLP